MAGEHDSVAQRLKPLFRDAFPDADVEAIGIDTVTEDIIGWDSMAHVTLVVGIEEEFGVTFAADEITGFSDVRELIALIARKSTHAND